MENPLFQNVQSWQFSEKWVFSDQAACKRIHTENIPMSMSYCTILKSALKFVLILLTWRLPLVLSQNSFEQFPEAHLHLWWMSRNGKLRLTKDGLCRWNMRSMNQISKQSSWHIKVLLQTIKNKIFFTSPLLTIISKWTSDWWVTLYWRLNVNAGLFFLIKETAVIKCYKTFDAIAFTHQFYV